mgnify:CR=1 FL=1
MKEKWPLNDIIPANRIRWPTISEENKDGVMENIHYILAVDKGMERQNNN